MSTTSYSAFDAGQTPPASLIAQVPSKMTDASSRALSDVESHVDVDGLRTQARKVQAAWKLCAAPRLRSLTLTTKWKNANRSISEAYRESLKATASGSKPAAIVEQLVDNPSLLRQALSDTQAWLP